MVWSHSQHQCSSPSSPSGICGTMSEVLRSGVAAASDAAAEGGAAGEPGLGVLEQQLQDDSQLHDDPPRETTADAAATSQPAETSAEPTAADGPVAAVAVADPGRKMLAEIQALKEEQKKVRDARKEVAKNLRNAERRRRRLKARACRLSDADLLAVISFPSLLPSCSVFQLILLSGR